MSSASGSASSDTVPVSSRGKKRRKKRNKTSNNKDAEEPKLSADCPPASKSPSETEDDSDSRDSAHLPVGQKSDDSLSSSSSSESDSDSDESVISLPPPLDGGWGWVVVIGSFFAHFLCDGLAYNAGIIYEHLHETFNSGTSETAWVSSVFLAVPYLLGPVAGAITNRYGCRAATVTGAVIGFVGCVLSYFVDSLAMLCVTFGVIFGLGQALVLFASSVIVPYYFEERRSLAYGMAVSGSGIGTAVLAPLLNTIMNEYGWRGMMLILGGLSLNLAVCGLLYRPLATREFKRRYRSKRNLEKFENMSRMSRDSSSLMGGTPPVLSASTRLPDTELDEFPPSVTDKLLPQLNGHFKHSGELEVINEDLTFADIADSTIASSPPAFTRSCDVVTFDVCPPWDFPSNIATVTEVQSNSSALVHKQFSERQKRRRRSKNPREVRLVPVPHRQPHTIAPLSRIDIFYRGSVLTNQQHKEKGSHALTTEHRVRALSCPQLNPHEPIKQTWRDAVTEFFIEVGTTMRRMASISILRRPLFIWFWISNFLFYMWFEVPLNYIPEYTTKLTGSEHSYVLVIVIGLVTCVGQIVFGYFCDKPWVSSILLYGVGVAVTGASTLFIPLISNFWGLSVYTVVFTFGSCGNTALDTIILTELLGMKRLTNSYGLLMVGQGLASLFGAPLAGYIIDLYNSELQGYVICFLHTGVWLLVSGLMIAVITPCVKRFRRWNPCRREDDDEDESEDEETKQTCNKDLEAGISHRSGSSSSPDRSPDHLRKRGSHPSLVVATTATSTKLGILRFNRNGGGSSGHILDRQASPSDCGRSRSASTSELNAFPPQAHSSGSVAKEESSTSKQIEESAQKSEGEDPGVPLDTTTTSTSTGKDASTSGISESLSSGVMPSHLIAQSPTYAEYAVGYAECREGWGECLYKNRSLTVI